MPSTFSWKYFWWILPSKAASANVLDPIIHVADNHYPESFINNTNINIFKHPITSDIPIIIKLSLYRTSVREHALRCTMHGLFDIDTWQRMLNWSCLHDGHRHPCHRSSSMCLHSDMPCPHSADCQVSDLPSGGRCSDPRSHWALPLPSWAWSSVPPHLVQVSYPFNSDCKGSSSLRIV